MRRLAAAAALLACCLTTACSTSPSKGSSFSTWYNNGGRQHIADLTADVHAMATAAGPDQMGTACASLGTHDEAALAYGPIPDAEAQQHWSKMLNIQSVAAHDCVDGIRKPDRQLYDSSIQEFQLAQTESDALQARFAKLGADTK